MFISIISIVTLIIFLLVCFFFFFFNDTATTEIYTLSLHDALPIYTCCRCRSECCDRQRRLPAACFVKLDRKSTRLNSSHDQISYAVFCLKKKKNKLSHLLIPLLQIHPLLTVGRYTTFVQPHITTQA